MKIFLVLTLLLSSNAFCDIKCEVITSDNICVQINWADEPVLNKNITNTIRLIDLEQSSDEELVLTDPDSPIQFQLWKVGSVGEHGSRPIKTIHKEVGTFQNTNIYFTSEEQNPGKWQLQMQMDGLNFVLYEIKL